ncbi:MAG: M4 family metallopeptidase [Clostridia bacterium]|nr:M4 family metallopeptidase [Clostridia bacterium]
MKRRWKSWLSAALAALMLFGGCASLSEAAKATPAQLTPEDLEALGATARFHDGHVTFVDGACAADPVMGMDDAARVLEGMIDLLGGDARTQFEPWRDFSDTAGNRYYVFQQMYAETTVSGGAVKVVTDATGHMLGLVGSVEGELPDVREAEGITAQDAEALALKHMADGNMPRAELVEGRTEQIILPVNLELDPDSDEEKEESRFVWAVYTDNPGMGQEKGSDFPYLAHYVTMDGEYLYNLPTVVPGDEASTSGFDAAYAFDSMEPVEYTGTVKLSDGGEQAIDVTLMRDRNTGLFYMGNIERRIAVADCWEFVYNGGNVVLESSEDNAGWDDNCLLALYNYCRAWDYYHEIGWTGGDGLGTPMLILRDFCNRDHEPMDNAAYAGKYYGWQVFLSSSANDLSQCLDVLGHEFTHCVTSSVMTYNAYMNDYGAINEAISDIQGNLCEMLCGATEDTVWTLGEHSGTPVRSMSDPHRYAQPEYAWDIHYVPKVKAPTDLNDHGGVHNNSSLLNSVAYRLCVNGGMTLEEARAFWFAVDCSMTPDTDYAQLSELLPWVLKNLGMERYTAALEAAMDATRIRTDAMPDVFDEDRALVTLTLPDSETFADGNWALLLVTVDTDGIVQRLKAIFAREGEYADALEELAELMGVDPALVPTAEEIERDGDHAWDRLLDEVKTMLGSEAPKSDQTASMEGLADWLGKYFDDTVYAGTGAAGQDGRTVRMVCRPGRTVPVLFRLELDHDLHVVSASLAVYTLHMWLDAGALLAPLMEDADLFKAPEPANDAQDADDLSWLADLFGGDDATATEPAYEPPAWLTSAFSMVFRMDWLRDLLFFDIAPGAITELPGDGLEDVMVLDAEHYPAIDALLFTDRLDK